MANPDEAQANLRAIIADFADFCSQDGGASEADTRAKLIDRVLKEVCDWPESMITREDHVDRGYIDYCLTVHSRRYVAVEAKKEGIAFTLPTQQTHKTLKISGTLWTDKPIKEAITQVRGYCDDAVIRYAVATNGYAWIVFRALREDIAWKEGTARIFPSLEYIVDNFTEFWNLLSYNAITSGSLDEEFGSPNRKPRQLLRVVDRLFNADLPLQRNRLHNQLHPIIQTIFEDIADQDPLEILQSCYVHTDSLRIVAQDLDTIITDAIPQFLLDQGAEPISQGRDDAGRFGLAIAQAMPSRRGHLFLLLGGIGSGKTTFIKRYERTVGKGVLDKRALWFHIDFLAAPVDPKEMELFVWRSVLEQLRTRYVSPHLETRWHIKRAFADEIAAISETGLRHLKGRTDEYERALSPYLEKWQADTADYTPRLLRLAKTERKLEIVLFIDNVDQLSPAYQAQVFVLAQRVTRTIGSTTILALREESYYAANVQKTLTAYTSRKFHIASPRFRKMIDNRIRFALEVLERKQGPVDYVLPGRTTFDNSAIADFLKIIEYSIFEHNRNIARFIEAICFGNMRLALEMFSTFLTSGATDVDKMLNIYRREGQYFVAYHEFVKSIMLGERQYYKESASPILNVFDCGAEKNSSHFTALRLIHLLLQRRGEQTREGQGYVEISKIVSMFEDTFDNREDVLRTLNRLVARQLIEANTRSTDSIGGASHVRVTSAGWYYARFLVMSFAYLDLALQDTPLDDDNTERDLRRLVDQVGNLGDRQDQKVARMQVRYERVRRFLSYLKNQEDVERKRYDLPRSNAVLGFEVVQEIIDKVESQVRWIDERIRENRESIKDDFSLGTGEDEAETDDEATSEPGAV